MPKKQPKSELAVPAPNDAEKEAVWVNPELDRILKGEDAALGQPDRAEAVQYWVTRKTRQPIREE